ncbi:DUF488 domain-containing protein [Flavobacterium sp.]
MKTPVIYTIGHSTHPIADFLSMLKSFDIKTVADIRRFPGSRKFPQFDQENLKISLEEASIGYIHLIDLGGRRKANKDSKNIRWHNDSFKGYADYMETGAFEKAVKQLEQLALKQPTVYMCSEAVWWRCHRSMVSDYLKANGWSVVHIMAVGKFQDHRYTSPARIVNHKVVYTEEQ